jgi:hypothetical protein
MTKEHRVDMIMDTAELFRIAHSCLDLRFSDQKSWYVVTLSFAGLAVKPRGSDSFTSGLLCPRLGPYAI